MHKILTYLTVVVLAIAGCTEDHPISEENESLAELPPHRQCAAIEVLETQMKADPKFRARLENIELQTREFIESGRTDVTGQITIPVIVNVIYRTDMENIPMEQIESQIDVLNEDFNAQSAGIENIPGRFENRVADMDMNFVLQGVNRKFSNREVWSLNDDMKRTSEGGLDPVSPENNLNIWVVNKIMNDGKLILGYAQFPGGDPATDGVVVGFNFFGRTGFVSAPFDQGRTTTHEIGHWLNMRHIWGDDDCGDDLVGDTPPHDTFNYGCLSYPHLSVCNDKPELTMNFMDYTDDACMYMFTKGQKYRARSLFDPKRARSGIRQ